MRRLAALLVLAMVPAAPALAGVGAITGEKTIAQSLTEHAAACRAGVPASGVVSGTMVPLTVDVPGLESLRCFAARLASDGGRARSSVERLTCDAPDRTVDLRCEMTIALSESSYNIDKNRYDILAAAVAAGLDADRIAILPDRIELAGTLTSEKARTELEAALAKSALRVPVRTLGLRVRVPPKPEAMPMLAKGTGPAQLHLAGLPAPAALSMAGDPARPFVALAEGDPLTGRIAAANRAGLAKALAAAHPVKSVPVAFSGKGRKVDLSFQSVDTQHLTALLGDAMGANVVTPADAKALSVFTKSVPVDSAMAAIAKVLGLTQVRQGSTIFLVPAGAKIRASGPKESLRTLMVEGATAAEALSLVVAEAPIPFCLPEGKPVRAKVRNVTATVMAEALRVIDGSEAGDAAGCVRAPSFAVKSQGDFAGLRLIATLTGTAPSRALVRKDDGSVAILESTSLTITQTGVVLKVPGERGELTLASAAGTAPEAPLLDHRLIATLVSAQGSLAVLEGRRGRIRVVQRGWTANDGSVEILPGVLRIATEGYDAYGYRTRATTDLPLH